MKVRTYPDAETFLSRTREELESNEASNGLILGVCDRLVRHPERTEAAPCLKTVENGNGLVVVAMMTPPHKLVVYGYQGGSRRGIGILVEDLVAGGWSVPGVLGPSEVAERTAARWTEITGGGYRLERRQRLYELREVISPVPERGRLRCATAADIDLVARWSYEFAMAIFGEADRQEVDRSTRSRIGEGDTYLWEDGAPVSIAMKTRPTRRGISVSLVYTPPRLRRRGYATACVGELSRMLLREGREFCTLFADLSNETANRLYQRIGYRPVCDYDEFVFSEGE
jgi:predicted GNAT family acetyltransferase